MSDGGQLCRRAVSISHNRSYDSVMDLGWLSGLPWALIISACSLAISVMLAIREFSARAIPFGWVHEMSLKSGGRWEYVGKVLHISNVGKQPFTVEAVGSLNKAIEGVSGPAGEFIWLPDQPPIENPETPLMVLPGELTVFRFPSSGFPQGGPSLAVQIVRRNPWHWVPWQKQASRRWVKFKSASQDHDQHALHQGSAGSSDAHNPPRSLHISNRPPTL
jgi:hypothetical protein